MSESKKFNFAATSFFYSAADWDNVDLSDDSIPLIGTVTNKIIRLGTKNIIEAPEKSFKTTFFQRLALGMSNGWPVYKDFPVAQACRVLYFHGELAPGELAERRACAIATIPDFKGDEYIEGRSVNAHFITATGQADIRSHVHRFRPVNGLPYVVVFDPWQEFITGFDENSFEDMSKATKFLNTLMSEVNCTLFIQMHQGKDRTKGARGHSSIAGWKDTTIRLTRKGDLGLLVRVEPRWAEKFEFGLVFKDGTMHDKNIFSPQSSGIRLKVEKAGGKIIKERFTEFLGPASDARRKAIQRALDDKAIAYDSDKNLVLPWEEFDWAPPEL